MNYYRGMVIGDGDRANNVWEFRVTNDLADGDSVSSVDLTAVDAGVTVTEVSVTTVAVFLRITGGTKGVTYSIEPVLTTAQGNVIPMLVNYTVANP